ncbi:hypothetical protein GQX74_009182 [Glossina fuscipes]|nr:hypothetical protein GQX74_009182 [Glossina fuscipes]
MMSLLLWELDLSVWSGNASTKNVDDSTAKTDIIIANRKGESYTEKIRIRNITEAFGRTSTSTHHNNICRAATEDQKIQIKMGSTTCQRTGDQERKVQLPRAIPSDTRAERSTVRYVEDAEKVDTKEKNAKTSCHIVPCIRHYKFPMFTKHNLLHSQQNEDEKFLPQDAEVLISLMDSKN